MHIYARERKHETKCRRKKPRLVKRGEEELYEGDHQAAGKLQRCGSEERCARRNSCCQVPRHRVGRKRRSAFSAFSHLCLSPNLISTCISSIRQDEDKYQLGKTKIFFRAGQVAYLEKLRSDTLRRSMVRIQSHVRAFLQRQKYERLRAAAIALQQYARGLLARQLAKAKRETAAAKRIQAAVRGWVARRRYLRTCRAIQTMQRFARGESRGELHLYCIIALQSQPNLHHYDSRPYFPPPSFSLIGMHGRREFRARKRVYCATLLQASFRMWQARKAFLKTRAAIVVLQCGVRRVNARRALKKLKTEARSVEGIRARNTGLEKKIMELQQTMDRRVKAAQEQQVCHVWKGSRIDEAVQSNGTITANTTRGLRLG